MEACITHASNAAANKCGAKTKRGTPCQKIPMKGRTRCRLHGGASPVGFGHPSFKHGAYSRYSVFSAGEKLLRQRERQKRAFARLEDKAYEVALRDYPSVVARIEAQLSVRRRGRPRKIPVEVPHFNSYYFDVLESMVRQDHQRYRERLQRRQAAQLGKIG